MDETVKLLWHEEKVLTFLRLCFLYLKRTGLEPAPQSSTASDIEPWKAQTNSVLQPWKAQADSVLKPRKAQTDTVLQPWKTQTDSVLQPWKAQAGSVLQPWKAQPDSVLQPWKAQADSVLQPFIRVAFHKGGLSLGWSFIRDHQGVVSHQIGLSLGWPSIRVVFHQQFHCIKIFTKQGTLGFPWTAEMTLTDYNYIHSTENDLNKMWRPYWWRWLIQKQHNWNRQVTDDA